MISDPDNVLTIRIVISDPENKQYPDNFSDDLFFSDLL